MTEFNIRNIIFRDPKKAVSIEGLITTKCPVDVVLHVDAITTFKDGHRFAALKALMSDIEEAVVEGKGND